MNSNECDSDIYEILNSYQEAKEKASAINKAISYKRKSYMECMQIIRKTMDELKERHQSDIAMLSSELKECEDKCLSMHGLSIPVRLGDLIKEISKLSSINEKNISVRIVTDIKKPGLFSGSDMINLLNRDDTEHKITLFIDGVDYSRSNMVMYVTEFKLDKSFINLESNFLKNHCSLRVVKNKDYSYSEIVVDRNVSDVVLNFGLEHIDAKEDYCWYPANIFTQAIINCTSKNNKKKKSRVKHK